MKNKNTQTTNPYRYFAVYRCENNDGSYFYGNSVDEFKYPIRTYEDILLYRNHILEILHREGRNAKHVIIFNIILIDSPKEV